MPNFNRVVLVGHVTRDPEIRNTPSGVKVAKFGLAVNNPYKKDDVLFVDIVAFNKTADVIERFTKKGDAILVEGRLQLEQWDDKATGQKRSKHSIAADSVQFMGGGKGDGPRQSGPRTVTTDDVGPPDDGIPI